MSIFHYNNSIKKVNNKTFAIIILIANNFINNNLKVIKSIIYFEELLYECNEKVGH